MDSFFGIGMFELIMIAVIALLVMGPERLPNAMRELAKYMRQLRNISTEFQSQFSEELKLLDEINPKRILNEVMDPNAPAAAKPPAPKPAPPTPKPVTTQSPKPAPKPAPTNTAGDNSILPPALGGTATLAGKPQLDAGEASGNSAGVSSTATAPPVSQPELADGTGASPVLAEATDSSAPVVAAPDATAAPVEESR